MRRLSHANTGRPSELPGRALTCCLPPGKSMYRYNAFDREFLRERVGQYRDQVERRLSGALTEDEFKPLRLMNGVYLQLHAYMLRVAIPYGTLSARQMRGLADIAERWDRVTVTSPRDRTSSSTGRNWSTRLTFSRRLPIWICMPFRQAAIRSVM